MKRTIWGIMLVFSLRSFIFSEGLKIANVNETTDETTVPYNASVRGGIAFEKIYESPGSAFMAIHFNYFKLAKDDYLTVSNDDHSEEYVYAELGKKDWQGKFMPEFWSRLVRGSIIKVTIHSRNTAKLDRSFRVSIDKISCGFTDAEMSQALRDEPTRAVCGSDDKKWAKCYEPSEMYTKGKAVARLYIDGGSACTGWLIGSAGHLMTNNHCFSNQTSANNTEYEFMGEGATCTTDCSSWLGCRGTIESTTAQFIVTSADATLDYTLVKLPTNVTSKYGYLQLRSTLAAVGERIYIPQHPLAYGKQIVVADDQSSTGYAKIDTLETNNIQYMADTDSGSSGSPVLAYSDNLVVGLHHLGGCANSGVKIPLVISGLGSNLPPNAIGGSTSVTAGFTVTTYSGNTNALFADASSSNGCSIVAWSWNFGDGSTSTAQNPPIHGYASAGTYTASLTVTSNQTPAQSSTKTQAVTVPQQISYCPSASGSGSSEWIAKVQVGTFSNSSTGSTYTDFTGKTIDMTIGQAYAVTLTPGFSGGTYTEYFELWIDVNHNGVFTDSGEEFVSKSGTSAVTGTITIPTGAVTGPTRMRISMKYGAKPTSCETSSSFSYGEVEDYTGNIVGSVGKELFVAGFSGAGVWTFDPNDGTWAQWNVNDASILAVGDINGNGVDDVAGVYGLLGLWIRYDNATWTKVNVSGNPVSLAVGDVDGNGTGEIIGVWSGIGAWAYHVSGNSWTKILAKDASQISAGDYDLDGKDEVLGWWSPEGLYMYNMDSAVWVKVLDETSLIQIATGDMNGDKRDDVLGIWTHGTWFYDIANSGWTRIYDTADKIASGDLDGGGSDDLIGVWAAVPGIWVRTRETGAWAKIHDTLPACFAAGKLK